VSPLARFEYRASTTSDFEDLFRSVNGWESDGYTLYAFTQAYDPAKKLMMYTAFFRRPV
jgi:hypothetical protein